MADGTNQRGAPDSAEPFMDAHPNPGSPEINEGANKFHDTNLPNMEYQNERNNQLWYTYDGAGDPPPIFDDPNGEKNGMD